MKNVLILLGTVAIALFFLNTVRNIMPSEAHQALMRGAQGMADRGVKVQVSEYMPSMEACRKRVDGELSRALGNNAELGVVDMKEEMKKADPAFKDDIYSFVVHKNGVELWNISCMPRNNNQVAFLKARKMTPQEMDRRAK